VTWRKIGGHRSMSDEQGDNPEGWVDRHGDGLYRYALLRLRAPDLAADVVQETFLEALRARASFAGRSSERTWLIGILRHKIVDQIRRSGRESVTVNGCSSNGDDPGAFDRRGHWRVGPASWAGNPSRQIETEEFWDVFGRCLSKLPKGVADAFFLRELDGLTAPEVQQTLGITPANLWKRLHRARALLRGCLETTWFGQRTKHTPPFLRGPVHS
jgi:RNA polymerase sigma-70 factor (ECF subfamily)